MGPRSKCYHLLNTSFTILASLSGRAKALAMATSTVCSMLSTLCIGSNAANNVKANKTTRAALPLPSSSTFGVSTTLKFSFQSKSRLPVTAMGTSEEEEGAEVGGVEPVVVGRSDFDDWPEETEEEITAAYEAIYGPAYSGVSVLGNNVDEVDKLHPTGLKLRKKPGKIKDGFEERVVQVRRVTKVVKGGKRLSFRAIVVVGDKKGRVGVGVGKAREVLSAVQKSAADARRHVVTVPLTKYLTFPHRADGHYGAAHVMLRPASPGTGVIAGGAVKVMLEMAGVVNALGKQLRSENPLNNARAVVHAVSQMSQFREVAERRGIPMEELWQ